MAQNIKLWGATYSNVPAVLLPKSTSGTAKFTDVSDTTAAASDVASGMYFYDANGTRTQGTASGGGGTTKLVQGEFNTGTTTGTTKEITIPYTGSGYPIAAFVFVKNGAYNSSGASTWYNSMQRYAVGQWAMTKAIQTSAPTYGTSGSANYGVTEWIYKNSTSQATTYSRSSAMTTNAYTSNDATGAGATCVRFKSAKKMTIYVASTSYGLLANIDYQYIVIYSS